MPRRDPALRKFRVAVYVVYGLLVAWIVVSFSAAVARGVYSDEGRDRLAAREAADALCSAAAAAKPPIRIDGCPEEVRGAGPAAHLQRARSATSSMHSGPLRDRVSAAVTEIENATRPGAAKTGTSNVSEIAREFLD